MVKISHSTDAAPGAVGPYSQAVSFGNTLYISGQLPVDPVTCSIPESPSEQAEQVLSNIRNIAESAGYRMDDAVKLTLFIKNLDDFSEINGVYAKFFTEPYPARSCVQVSGIPKGADMEIDAVFMKD